MPIFCLFLCCWLGVIWMSRSIQASLVINLKEQNPFYLILALFLRTPTPICISTQKFRDFIVIRIKMVQIKRFTVGFMWKLIWCFGISAGLDMSLSTNLKLVQRMGQVLISFSFRAVWMLDFVAGVTILASFLCLFILPSLYFLMIICAVVF